MRLKWMKEKERERASQAHTHAYFKWWQWQLYLHRNEFVRITKCTLHESEWRRKHKERNVCVYVCYTFVFAFCSAIGFLRRSHFTQGAIAFFGYDFVCSVHIMCDDIFGEIQFSYYELWWCRCRCWIYSFCWIYVCVSVCVLIFLERIQNIGSEHEQNGQSTNSLSIIFEYIAHEWECGFFSMLSGSLYKEEIDRCCILNLFFLTSSWIRN